MKTGRQGQTRQERNPTRRRTVDPSKALTDALTTLKKKAGTSRGTKEKGGKSSVWRSADFKNARGAGGRCGGGEGDGPGGNGIYDVYMGQVILAVRPNWVCRPTPARTLRAGQRESDPNGRSVLNCTVAAAPAGAEVVPRRSTRSSGPKCSPRRPPISRDSR